MRSSSAPRGSADLSRRRRLNSMTVLAIAGTHSALDGASGGERTARNRAGDSDIALQPYGCALADNLTLSATGTDIPLSPPNGFVGPLGRSRTVGRRTERTVTTSAPALITSTQVHGGAATHPGGGIWLESLIPTV
jgi:hypothetical protein